MNKDEFDKLNATKASEGKANFNFYLNRQGAQGQKGEKGDQGYSPKITVAKDTPQEYTLRIENENETFETSNLREHKEDRGGTYYRYDRAAKQGYLGEADKATETQAGIIKVATSEDFTNQKNDAAVTPASLANANPLRLGVIDNRDETVSGVLSYIQINPELVPVDNGVEYKYGFANKWELWSNGVRDDHGADYILNQASIKSSDKSVTVARTKKGIDLTTNVKPYNLPVATATTLGGVKVDNVSVKIAEDGTLSVEMPKVPTKTSDLQNDSEYITKEVNNLTNYTPTTGLAQVAKTGDYNDLINKPENGGGGDYVLPPATTSTLGGIKVGQNLTITSDGTLNATGGDTSNLVTKDEFNARKTAVDIALTNKQEVLTAGEGIVIEKRAENTYISAVGRVSSNDKYGIRGDYATHYGILEAPNGILENTNNKELVLKQGTIMKLAGNGAARTIIANDANHTLTASQDVTLFFAEGGNFLEATDVFYSEDEPQNGETGYAAWWKPSLGKWQFKSNDTGNIWRDAVATPIANIRANAELISGIDHIGYRILDDGILAFKPDVETLVESKQDKLVAQNGITVKKQPIGSYDPVNKTPFEVTGTVVKQLFTNDLYSTTKTYVIFKATGNFIISPSTDTRLSNGLSFNNNKVGDFNSANLTVINETDCDYEGQYVMLAWENVANSQIPEVRVAPFLSAEWKVVLPANRDNGKVVKPNNYINANYYNSAARFEELYLVNNFVEVKDVISANIDNQLIQLNSQGQLTVNMDEIGADLTTKANTDLSNLTEAGKQVIKDNAGGSTGGIISEKYPAQLPEDGDQTTIKKLEFDAANKKILVTYDYITMEGGIHSDRGTFTTKIPLDINTIKAGLGVQTITKVTQAQYDQLATKDKWTLYIVVG